jgi:transposase
MLVKTVLNRVEHFKSFVFFAVSFQLVNGSKALVVEIKVRTNSLPECPECGRRGRKYDMMQARLFEYVPIWAFQVFFRYAPRRVASPNHGAKVGAIPLAYGKERMAISYQVYLARWAMRLSWKEAAEVFKTSWLSDSPVCGRVLYCQSQPR